MISLAKSFLNRMEEAARGIGNYVNVDTTVFLCFKKKEPSLSGKPLRLLDQFPYLGNNISSTESNVNIYIGKARTVIDRLSIIWKSDLW